MECEGKNFLMPSVMAVMLLLSLAGSLVPVGALLLIVLAAWLGVQLVLGRRRRTQQFSDKIELALSRWKALAIV